MSAALEGFSRLTSSSFRRFDHEKWLPSLIANDIDLETLSTLRTDEDLKQVGVSAIGARRRLLREVPNLPNKGRWAPVFYSYQNSKFIYISWPPNRAEEFSQKKSLDQKKSDANPFAEFLRRKAGGKIFRYGLHIPFSKFTQVSIDFKRTIFDGTELTCRMNLNHTCFLVC